MRTRRQWSHAVPGVVVGAVLIAGAALVLGGYGQDPSPRRLVAEPQGPEPEGYDVSRNVPPFTEPFGPAGERVSLDSAESSTAYEVREPHSEVADRSRLEAVWLTSDKRVALEFSTGVVIFMTPGKSESRFLADWSGQIATEGYPGRLEKVRGHTAVVVDYVEGKQKAVVMFVEDGVQFELYGTVEGGHTADQLVAAAESLE